MRSCVKPGQEVTVTQSELRGQGFKGQVARTAGVDRCRHAHDADRGRRCRTATALLLPGAYVQVSLPLAGEQGADDADERADHPRRRHARRRRRRQRAQVALKPIKVGRNYGETVEVLEGVATGTSSC